MRMQSLMLFLFLDKKVSRGVERGVPTRMLMRRMGRRVDHLNPVSCYLGPEGIKKYLTHPYASPLFGDFTGLPPMLVQA
jgi:hypothetical protein